MKSLYQPEFKGYSCWICTQSSMEHAVDDGISRGPQVLPTAWLVLWVRGVWLCNCWICALGGFHSDWVVLHGKTDAKVGRAAQCAHSQRLFLVSHSKKTSGVCSRRNTLHFFFITLETKGKQERIKTVNSVQELGEDAGCKEVGLLSSQGTKFC